MAGLNSSVLTANNVLLIASANVDAVITNAVRMLNRSDGPVADVLDCARKLVPLDRRHVERRIDRHRPRRGEGA